MVIATLFIEAQANAPGMAASSLEKLVSDLAAEGVTITAHEVMDEEQETIDEKDTYSTFVEMSVDMELRDYLRLVMRVTPTSMEVLKAPKSVTASEAMRLLGDVCTVLGTCCQKAGVRLPMPDTQFGDERQDGPGITDDEYDDFLDQGYIHYKFVTAVAGNEEVIRRDILRVLNVLGAYVNKIKLQEQGEQGEGFSGLAAVDAMVPDNETLFEIALRFNPVAMSIEEPEEITLSEAVVQDIAINLSSLVSDITNYITMKEQRLMPKGD